MKTNKIFGLALAGALLFQGAQASEIVDLPTRSIDLVKRTERSDLYIVDRDNLSDAITGGVLVAEKGAGLLTVDPANLSEEEEEVIASADNIYLLGGRDTLPAELEERANFKARYSGQSRFDTAVKIAEELGTDRDLALVNGLNLVDAITSTPLAELEDRNILLTSKDQLDEATKAYLEAYGQGKDLIFVGGEDSISTGVKEEALASIGSQADPEELTVAGANRYETSFELAARAGESSPAMLVEGADMEMAVNSVNLPGQRVLSILTSEDQLDDSIRAYEELMAPEKIYTAVRPVANVSGEQSDQLEEEAGPEENIPESDSPAQEQSPEPEEAPEDLVEPEAEPAQPVNPAQNFINSALAMEGWAYSQGSRMAYGYADCSSLVLKALINSGLTTDTGRNLTSGSIFSDPRFQRISFDQLRPGDVLHQPGHLAIFMGEGRVFEAKTWGVPAGWGNYSYRGWDACFRIQGL